MYASCAYHYYYYGHTLQFYYNCMIVVYLYFSFMRIINVQYAPVTPQ